MTWFAVGGDHFIIAAYGEDAVFGQQGILAAVLQVASGANWQQGWVVAPYPALWIHTWPVDYGGKCQNLTEQEVNRILQHKGHTNFWIHSAASRQLLVCRENLKTGNVGLLPSSLFRKFTTMFHVIFSFADMTVDLGGAFQNTPPSKIWQSAAKITFMSYFVIVHVLSGFCGNWSGGRKRKQKEDKRQLMHMQNNQKCSFQLYLLEWLYLI